jgi:hypothetical protein
MATFTQLSIETKTEIAIKMVVLDALELQGQVSPKQMIEYMNSQTFADAVKRYIDLMN